ncbi:hypothetical protein [Streptomyces sp. YIM S03343]
MSPGLKQPERGLVAALLVMAASLIFISLFDWPTFSGWVSYYLMCTVPISMVIGVIWQGEQPAFIAAQRQPLRGLLFLLLALAVGAVVAAVHFVALGGVSPPSPMLLQRIVASVVVVFLMTIMWGGWPFVLIRNPLAAGFGLLIGCYLLNYVLFQVFFNYEFMKGSSLYHAGQDPHGLFSASSAVSFYVTVGTIMFLTLHFDLWPLTRVPSLMKQPVLGLVWFTIALVLGAGVFTLGTQVLDMAGPQYDTKVTIPFIFGSIIVLNICGGSLFPPMTQPLKGLCSALTATVTGTVLSLLYGLLAPVVTGHLQAGPPAFDFEVWLSTALLAVTFPFLTFHADFFSMWPLAESREDGNEGVEQST